jgi:uncharacterized RDD family membrane protein YckC
MTEVQEGPRGGVIERAPKWLFIILCIGASLLGAIVFFYLSAVVFRLLGLGRDAGAILTIISTLFGLVAPIFVMRKKRQQTEPSKAIMANRVVYKFSKKTSLGLMVGGSIVVILGFIGMNAGVPRYAYLFLVSGGTSVAVTGLMAWRSSDS